MSDIDRLLEAADAWRGAPLALVTVIDTWGSAPRPRGSHMLVHADGRFAGSISGGCVEGEVLAAAAEVIARGGFRLLRYGVADESAWEVGLPCGGEIALLVQRVGPDGFAPELFQAIRASRGAGEALILTSDLDTGETRPAPATAANAFLNAYSPPRRIAIVGAVQIAQSLAVLCRELDIRPVVIDPRSRFLTAERFPGVELDDRWPDEAIATLQPDRATAVVTLSHDPKIDDPALAAALASPAGYIAALGSRRSHAKRLERLAASSFSTDQLARIDGPAGLDIGAVGPAEIALSIAAAAINAFGGKENRTGR